MAKSSHDFEADTDFVKVVSVSKYMKTLKSFSMPIVELIRQYQIRGYGPVGKGTEFWMLKTDFDYYDTHAISGVALELVDPVPEVEEVVPVATPEPEVIQKIVVPDDELTDLTLVKGVGPATAKALNEAGYDTVKSLETITYEKWAEVDKFATEDKYTKVRLSVEELING